MLIVALALGVIISLFVERIHARRKSVHAFHDIIEMREQFIERDSFISPWQVFVGKVY
jgi:hypothetical protein